MLALSLPPPPSLSLSVRPTLFRTAAIARVHDRVRLVAHIDSYKLTRPSRSVVVIPSAKRFIFFRSVMYSAFPAFPRPAFYFLPLRFSRPCVSLARVSPSSSLFLPLSFTPSQPLPASSTHRVLFLLSPACLHARVTTKFQMSRALPSPIN